MENGRATGPTPRGDVVPDRDERPEVARADGFRRVTCEARTTMSILTDRRGREHRIRTLQELLSNPVVGESPPEDGIAEPECS